MSERTIKLFGERNTATRAVMRMIDATPGIASAAATPDHEVTDKALRRRIAGVAGKMGRPWRKIYREAIKDEAFAAFPAVRAWKHCAPIYDPVYAADDISVLFTVRNPYSWAMALYRNPYHIMGDLPPSFAAFVDQPWLTVGRDQIDRLLITPLDLWNKKLAAYLEFMGGASAAGVPTSVLKFEDFVSEPPASFTQALSSLGIDCPNPVYDPAPTKRLGLSLRSRKTFYGRGDWAKSLQPSDIEAITDRINWDIAREFGYEKGNLH